MIRLKFHPGKQKGYYINTLAVILVATFVIAASMMLFKNQFVSTAGNGSSVPVTAQVSVAGLEMSMNVTPGPYFLSELVFVHMSLTNHSHTTFLLEGLQTTTPCGPALYLDQSGGANPRYTLPLNEDSVFVSCPHISSSELKTGQSITIQQYEPLTSSGHVMLSAKATFLKLEGGRNIHSSSPLDGHWPSLQLQVASHIPASRLLSLHVHDQQIRIDAPASVQPLYRFTETCDGMSLANGTPAWEPVSTHSLNVTNYMAGCSANHTRWQYAISAVGYAIVAQKYPL